jgi:hypothetical protein
MSRKGASVPYVLGGIAPQNKVCNETVPVYSVQFTILQSNKLETVLIYPMQFVVWHHEVSFVTKL